MPGLVSQTDVAVNLSRSSLVCHVHREWSSGGKSENAVLSGKQTTNRNALLSSKVLPTCVIIHRNNKIHVAGLNDP